MEDGLLHTYIGVKMIKAMEMTNIEFVKKQDKPIDEEMSKLLQGYLVVYPDGYESWSPKEVFESAYFKIENNDRISQADVDSFIKPDADCTTFENQTIVVGTTRSNFTIVESSTCVDIENYDEAIGFGYAMDKIKSRVWNHLGFLLACAKYGMNNK
jgi:hypothetical protein